MTGERAPPKFPIMFMLPASEPVCLPPMSMQAPQLPGMERSLPKLASPIARRAATPKVVRPPPAAASCCSHTETRSITAAPHSPTQPSVRRARAVLPSRSARLAAIDPDTNDPIPPKNSGTQPARARCMSVNSGKVSLRKVGIQVM